MKNRLFFLFFTLVMSASVNIPVYGMDESPLPGALEQSVVAQKYEDRDQAQVAAGDAQGLLDHKVEVPADALSGVASRRPSVPDVDEEGDKEQKRLLAGDRKTAHSNEDGLSADEIVYTANFKTFNAASLRTLLENPAVYSATVKRLQDKLKKAAPTRVDKISFFAPDDQPSAASSESLQRTSSDGSQEGKQVSFAAPTNAHDSAFTPQDHTDPKDDETKVVAKTKVLRQRPDAPTQQLGAAAPTRKKRHDGVTMGGARSQAASLPIVVPQPKDLKTLYKMLSLKSKHTQEAELFLQELRKTSPSNLTKQMRETQEFPAEAVEDLATAAMVVGQTSVPLLRATLITNIYIFYSHKCALLCKIRPDISPDQIHQEVAQEIIKALKSVKWQHGLLTLIYDDQKMPIICKKQSPQDIQELQKSLLEHLETRQTDLAAQELENSAADTADVVHKVAEAINEDAVREAWAEVASPDVRRVLILTVKQTEKGMDISLSHKLNIYDQQAGVILKEILELLGPEDAQAVVAAVSQEQKEAAQKREEDAKAAALLAPAKKAIKTLTERQEEMREKERQRIQALAVKVRQQTEQREKAEKEKKEAEAAARQTQATQPTQLDNKVPHAVAAFNNTHQVANTPTCDCTCCSTWSCWPWNWSCWSSCKC